jgi:hypothetical protein
MFIDQYDACLLFCRFFQTPNVLGCPWCSVLSQEGRKVEALKLLRKAAKYEPMVEKVFIPQLERELQQESWENVIEFLWFWGNERLLRPKLLIWSALVLTGSQEDFRPMVKRNLPVAWILLNPPYEGRGWGLPTVGECNVSCWAQSYPTYCIWILTRFHHQKSLLATIWHGTRLLAIIWYNKPSTNACMYIYMGSKV